MHQDLLQVLAGNRDKSQHQKFAQQKKLETSHILGQIFNLNLGPKIVQIMNLKTFNTLL